MLVLSSRLRYPVEKLFFSEQFSSSTVKFSCCCEVLAWFFVLPSVILVKSCSCKNNSRLLSSIAHVFYRYFKVSISYLFLHIILSLRHVFWVNFSYRFFYFPFQIAFVYCWSAIILLDLSLRYSLFFCLFQIQSLSRHFVHCWWVALYFFLSFKAPIRRNDVLG